MFGGVKIITSTYLEPDFYEIDFPTYPRRFYNQIRTRKAKARWAKQAEKTARPKWLNGFLMGDTMIVHPTLLDEIKLKTKGLT